MVRGCTSQGHDGSFINRDGTFRDVMWKGSGWCCRFACGLKAAWVFPRRSATSKSGSAPAPTVLLMVMMVCLLVYTAKQAAPDQSDTSGRYCLQRSWRVPPRALRPGSAPESAETVETWTRYGDNRSPTSCYPRQ